LKQEDGNKGWALQGPGCREKGSQRERKFSRFPALLLGKIERRYGPAKQDTKHFCEVSATYENY